MIRALAATLALLLASAAAAADDASSLGVSTAVDINFKRVTIQQNNGITTNTFNPEFRTINISPTLSYGRFFASIAIERSLGDASTANTINNGTIWSDRRYSREENYATAGYNVWAGLTFFAGYLDNTTTTNSVNISGSVNALRAESTDRGPFFGLGYSYRFTTGALTASAAAARLKGSQDTAGTLAPTNAEGDTTGASFGLSWSAPLSGSLNYRLGYKATRYEFKFNSGGIDQTNTRNYDSVFLGVSNHF